MHELHEHKTGGGRVNRVFQRKGSRRWYARFWVGNQLFRRSTGAITKAGAEDGLACFIKHFTRKLTQS